MQNPTPKATKVQHKLILTTRPNLSCRLQVVTFLTLTMTIGNTATYCPVYESQDHEEVRLA